MTLQRARLAHYLGIELNRNMNVEISNPLKEQKSAEPGQLPFTLNHELLIKTLQDAINRSTQQHRPMLTSYTQKIAWHDTIQAFSGARMASPGECFFGERTGAASTRFGVGAATC